MDERVRHPLTCVVAGPACCGITEFVATFIHHIEDMITLAPQIIISCCGKWQRCFDSIANMDFIVGFYSEKDLTVLKTRCWFSTIS